MEWKYSTACISFHARPQAIHLASCVSQKVSPMKNTTTSHSLLTTLARKSNCDLHLALTWRYTQVTGTGVVESVVTAHCTRRRTTFVCGRTLAIGRLTVVRNKTSRSEVTSFRGARISRLCKCHSNYLFTVWLVRRKTLVVWLRFPFAKFPWVDSRVALSISDVSRRGKVSSWSRLGKIYQRLGLVSGLDVSISPSSRSFT